MRFSVKALAGTALAALLALAAPAIAQEVPQDGTQEAGEDRAAGSEADGSAQAGTGGTAADQAMPEAIPEPVSPSPEIMALIEGFEEETHRTLWCAGAFGLLGTLSSDAQESAAFTAMAQGLLLSARGQLADETIEGTDFITIIAGYNALVIREFEAREQEPMRYTPAQCFEIAEVPDPVAPQSDGETPAQSGESGDAGTSGAPESAPDAAGPTPSGEGPATPGPEPETGAED